MESDRTVYLSYHNSNFCTWAWCLPALGKWAVFRCLLLSLCRTLFTSADWWKTSIYEIILLVCCSCFVLQMSRSSSTFSLNDSAKTSAMVQRSNSLDQPSLRTRVPVFICTPCTPVKIPSHSTSSQIDSESSQDFNLNCSSVDQESKCISLTPCTVQPNFSVSSPQNVTTVTQVTSTSSQAIQCSIQRRNLHLKSSRDMSRPLSTANLQARTPASQSDNVEIKTFSESHKDLQVLLEPCKAVLTSPRRETLL